MLKKFHNSYLAHFLLFNFFFLAYSLFSTLISVYLQDLGYSNAQVSLVVSSSFFASMLAQPIFGIISDSLGIKKIFLFSFLVMMVGAVFFMKATQLWQLLVWYSLVLMLINGVNPVMDVLAAQSPYTYGKIRIWGTIGYALGSQLAGLIYQRVAPQAIFPVFIGMMLISSLGLLGIQPKHDRAALDKKDIRKQTGLGKLLTNKTYLFYLLLVALYSGVGNTGHTYIPAMLQNSGLEVDRASTVVALSVLVEAPFIFYSYLFMDKISMKKLLYICLGIIFLQYSVYALNLGLISKIGMTLLSKHVTGMVLIMVTLKIVASLVDEKYLVTAIALVQTARSLGTILIQNLAGHFLDSWGYEGMNLFLAAIICLVCLLALFLKLPERKGNQLFG